MLKKLLKYDFKAVLKVWWIAAVAMLALGPVGGLCIYIESSPRHFPRIVYSIAGIGILLTVIGFVVFLLLTIVLLANRFYKNFFTDEGYLTFTLPVTRGQLLSSKLIVTMTTLVASAIVCLISWFFIMLIGVEDFWPDFKELWVEFWKLLQEEGFLGWAIVYVVEFIVIALEATLFSTLFLSNCITFGSIIAKKAKVVTSIVIYYLANNVFAFAMGIFLMFGTVSLGNWLADVNISETAEYSMVALLIFGIIAILGLLCSLLYTLQYWMVDRKLNLA